MSYQHSLPKVWDRSKWHGHRAGEKGGAGSLANIVEHAGCQTGNPAVFLPVGAGPGAWVRDLVPGCGQAF